MPQNRINWIDWAKAIAIYEVVLGHVSRSTDPQWTVDAATIGRIFHVPLFFLVSGYLFRIKENNFHNFIRNSAKSLVIPYLFFNIVSAAILWKYQSAEVYHNGLYGFLYVKGNAFSGPAWFLIVLFIIRLMAYGLQQIKSQYFQWGIVIALIIVSAVLPIKIGMGISGAILAFPFFFMGMYIKRLGIISEYIELPYVVKGILFIILFCICFVIRKLNLGMDIGNAAYNGHIVLSYLFVFLFVLMAASFCMLLNDVSLKVVRTISAGCIVIMGFHITVVQILWAYANKFPDSIQFLFYSPVNSITSFILSLFIAMFLQRYAPFLIGNRK